MKKHVLLLLIIIALLLVCIVQYYLLLKAKRIQKRILKSKRYIARDKNVTPIYTDSFVVYREHTCRVKWDKDLLSYFITPIEKDTVVKAIPFTVYTAKECVVCENVSD